MTEQRTREAIRDVADALNQMKQTTAEVLGLTNTPEVAAEKKAAEADAAARISYKLERVAAQAAAALMNTLDEDMSTHEAFAAYCIMHGMPPADQIRTPENCCPIKEQRSTAAAAAAAMDILRRTMHELAAIKAEATARAEVLQTVQAIEEVTK